MDSDVATLLVAIAALAKKVDQLNDSVERMEHQPTHNKGDDFNEQRKNK